jgi:hypothetical protein
LGEAVITSWQIYWITRLDSISLLLAIATFLSVFLFILSVFALEDIEDEKVGKEVGLFRKFLFFFSIAGAVLCSLTPTTKEMAAIILIPKLTNAVTQNEELKKLPNNLLSLANDWIVELRPDKKETDGK